MHGADVDPSLYTLCIAMAVFAGMFMIYALVCFKRARYAFADHREKSDLVNEGLFSLVVSVALIALAFWPLWG